MKRIYMAGSGGMLGHAFHEVFSDSYDLRCTDKDVNESWLEFLDFRDLEAYRKDVGAFKPDYLFHIGAHTDLEYCENDIEDAYLTNTTSAENAVWIANELDIPLLYISTAGIYDGSQDTFDDWDKPNPLGHYARSKYAGEVYVQQNARRHLICRAGWMMGGGPAKDKKFISKLMKQLKAGATELNVVNDKLGTPTYTVDFAGNVKALLEAEYWGLYNMVCEGVTGRLEVAQELIRVLGLSDKVKINEVGSEFFSKEFFAPRPDSERLINRKLNLRNMNKMRDWREALTAYIDASYRDYL
ncbi:MAG: SDR family oxidoreductase [Burkholderiaceae bacterium]